MKREKGEFSKSFICLHHVVHEKSTHSFVYRSTALKMIARPSDLVCIMRFCDLYSENR